jgi:hypothetical protein
MDFADVKPSVMSWLIVGIMALTFAYVAKMVFAKFNVPFVSDFVKAT